MKKTLTGVVMLLAGACLSYGQGTISLANAYALNNYIYVSYHPVTGSDVLLGGSSSGPAATQGNYASLVANGNDWTVQLWGAAGANASSATLTPLTVSGNPAATATATFANGANDTVPGTWVSSTAGVVAGALGTQQATVQLYAWYNAGGSITSYAAAQLAGVPVGNSALANVTLGGPPPSGPSGTPAVLPAGLGNFTVSAVPEPSTIALGVMGASAFLLRLRRKS